MYKVFIKSLDGLIVEITSSAFLKNSAGYIQVDEGDGQQFYHAQNYYLDGPLYTPDGIPRYKLVGGKPVERGAAEIAADRAAIVRTPTAAEQLRADVNFLAAMTGVVL